MSTDGETQTLSLDPTVDPTTVDASAIDPVEFANVVRTASDEDIDRALAAGREIILDEIFKRMVEHFRPDLATDFDMVVNWKLTGRPDGGSDEYQLVIRNGACTTGRGGQEQAEATLEMSAPDFLRVATGNALAAALFMANRLLIGGDVARAMLVQGFFDIPEPTEVGGAGH